MGIINTSPDSFAGDGLGYNIDAAVARARHMAAEGADIIDVGGESTHPGSAPISIDEELHRPILLASSRKSIIGRVLNSPPDQRLEGTMATIAIGIAKGADIVRVHDVKQAAPLCKMSDAIIRGWP